MIVPTLKAVSNPLSMPTSIPSHTPSFALIPTENVPDCKSRSGDPTRERYTSSPAPSLVRLRQLPIPLITMPVVENTAAGRSYGPEPVRSTVPPVTCRSPPSAGSAPFAERCSIE